MRNSIKRIKHNDDLQRIRKIGRLFDNTINLLNELGKVSDTIEEAKREAVKNGGLPKYRNANIGKQTIVSKFIRPFKTIAQEIKVGKVDVIGKAVIHNLFKEIQQFVAQTLMTVNQADMLLQSGGIEAKSILQAKAKLTKLFSALDTNRNKIFVEIAAHQVDKPFKQSYSSNGIDIDAGKAASGKYGKKYPGSNDTIIDLGKNDYSVHDSIRRRGYRDDLFDEGKKLSENANLIFVCIKKGEIRDAIAFLAATNHLIKLSVAKYLENIKNDAKLAYNMMESADKNDKVLIIKNFFKKLANSIIDVNRTKERLTKAFEALKSLTSNAKEYASNVNLGEKLKSMITSLKDLIKRLLMSKKKYEEVFVKYNTKNMLAYSGE